MEKVLYRREEYSYFTFEEKTFSNSDKFFCSLDFSGTDDDMRIFL